MRRLLIATAILVSACGGGSNSTPTTPTNPSPPPPPQNRAPSIGSATLAPSFGIAQLTAFHVSAQASDPDGDALTYQWTIDGQSRQGQSFEMPLTASGSASLTVTDGRGGSASAVTPPVTVGSMTGMWDGTPCPVLKGWRFLFTLTQNGGTITGKYTDNIFGDGKLDPAAPGSITAAGDVKLRVKLLYFNDFEFHGKMDQTGRVVAGGLFGSGFHGCAVQLVKR